MEHSTSNNNLKLKFLFIEKNIFNRKWKINVSQLAEQILQFPQSDIFALLHT